MTTDVYEVVCSLPARPIPVYTHNVSTSGYWTSNGVGGISGWYDQVPHLDANTYGDRSDILTSSTAVYQRGDSTGFNNDIEASSPFEFTLQVFHVLQDETLVLPVSPPAASGMMYVTAEVTMRAVSGSPNMGVRLYNYDIIYQDVGQPGGFVEEAPPGAPPEFPFEQRSWTDTLFPNPVLDTAWQTYQFQYGNGFGNGFPWSGGAWGVDITRLRTALASGWMRVQLDYSGGGALGVWDVAHVKLIVTLEYAGAPIRRVFPRDDAFAGGAPRVGIQSKAIQSSNRVGGGSVIV